MNPVMGTGPDYLFNAEISSKKTLGADPDYGMTYSQTGAKSTPRKILICIEWIKKSEFLPGFRGSRLQFNFLETYEMIWGQI